MNQNDNVRFATFSIRKDICKSDNNPEDLQGRRYMKGKANSYADVDPLMVDEGDNYRDIPMNMRSTCIKQTQRWPRTSMLALVFVSFLNNQLYQNQVLAFQLNSYHASKQMNFYSSANMPDRSRLLDDKSRGCCLGHNLQGRKYNNELLHMLSSKNHISTRLQSKAKSLPEEVPVPTSITTDTRTEANASASDPASDPTSDPRYQTAVRRTLLSIGASTLFGISILHWMGPKSAEEFFAGYIVEQSLSVDNLFVFLLLFDYFQVPLPYQNCVLNYGIAGAVIMRAIVIALGGAVLHRFKPVLLVFASILIFSSYTALSSFVLEGDGEEDEKEDMGDNAIVKFSRSLFPTTEMYDGSNFFTTLDGGVQKATPLLLCLVAVEISDIVFAIDSIPAVFGVTEDSFIVFTSNIFAILGLRSLYTVLSKAAADLEYLEPAVAVVLGFIGSKMVAEYFGFLVPTLVSLIVVASVLSFGIGLSIMAAATEPMEEDTMKPIDET